MDLEQALTAELLAAGFGLDLVWENGVASAWDGSAYRTTRGVYVPTEGRPYLEVRTLENDTTPATLGGSDQTDGVLRVVIRWPRDEGAAAPRAKVAEIFAALPIGARIQFEGGALVVVASQRRPGMAENGWYAIQADTTYQAHSKRN